MAVPGLDTAKWQWTVAAAAATVILLSPFRLLVMVVVVVVVCGGGGARSFLLYDVDLLDQPGLGGSQMMVASRNFREDLGPPLLLWLLLLLFRSTTTTTTTTATAVTTRDDDDHHVISHLPTAREVPSHEMPRDVVGGEGREPGVADAAAEDAVLG